MGRYSWFALALLVVVWIAASSGSMAQGGLPVIVTQPQSQTVCNGQTVTLTVEVSGDWMSTWICVSWLFFDVSTGSWVERLVSCEGDTSYTIQSFSAADAGSYVCRVIGMEGMPIPTKLCCRWARDR